jgi:hypothetical protein
MLAERTIPSADATVTVLHNQPPSQIEQAAEAFRELQAYLKDTPAIINQVDAKTGGGYLERTRMALKEAREERETKTSPIREKLNTIYAAYELVKDKGVLERAYNELRKRLTAYATRVEAERIAEVERLRLEAEAKEQAAREAERAEQDAIACADVGECTDVAGAIKQADQAFDQFKRADRKVQVAERSVPVRLGSVMGGRSISMRNYETLVIDGDPEAKLDNAILALRAMGVTAEIEAALIAAAKKYREAFAELPAGIIATIDRRI